MKMLKAITLLSIALCVNSLANDSYYSFNDTELGQSYIRYSHYSNKEKKLFKQHYFSKISLSGQISEVNILSTSHLDSGQLIEYRVHSNIDGELKYYLNCKKNKQNYVLSIYESQRKTKKITLVCPAIIYADLGSYLRKNKLTKSIAKDIFIFDTEKIKQKTLAPTSITLLRTEKKGTPQELKHFAEQSSRGLTLLTLNSKNVRVKETRSEQSEIKLLEGDAKKKAQIFLKK